MQNFRIHSPKVKRWGRQIEEYYESRVGRILVRDELLVSFSLIEDRRQGRCHEATHSITWEHHMQKYKADCTTCDISGISPSF